MCGIAYETWGELAPDGSNAVLVLHALTGDSHVAGARRARATPPRAGGTRWSVRGGRSTRRAGSSSRPTCWAAARAAPGRRRPRRTGGRGAAGSRWSPSRDSVAAEVVLADALGVAAVGVRRRRLDGRDAGAGVGRDRAGPGASGCSCWPARPRRRPTRSAGRRRSSRRSAADPGWRGGDYHARPAGDGPARRAGHRPADGAPELPQRVRAGAAVRPRAPGRRGPAARRPLRRRVLPRPPRRQAGAPVRRRRPTCG